MFYRAPSNLLPLSSLHKLVFWLITLALVSALAAQGLSDPAPAQNKAGLRFELPRNGNIRIENLRGAIIVEVWEQNYVSVAATNDSGQAAAASPVVDRGETLLSVRLARGPAGAPQTNLELSVPARAHLAIV